jgi:hypothetical protein
MIFSDLASPAEASFAKAKSRTSTFPDHALGLLLDGLQLALHPLVEPCDADHDALVGAAADDVDGIVGVNAEGHGAPFDALDLGRRGDA